MSEKSPLKTGIIGTLVAAICCFTPLLVIALGAIGLSAWVSGLDYVLFPVMFASMGLTAHSLYLRAGRSGPNPISFIAVLAIGFSALLIWLEFRYALRITLAAAALVGIYAYYLRSVSNTKKNNDGTMQPS